GQLGWRSLRGRPKNGSVLAEVEGVGSANLGEDEVEVVVAFPPVAGEQPGAFGLVGAGLGGVAVPVAVPGDGLVVFGSLTHVPAEDADGEGWEVEHAVFT